jgi:RNA polymerase sigma-70 factor, ECF subfamily
MVFLNDVYRYAQARLGHREDAEDIAIEVVQALPNPCHRRDLRIYMIGMARRKIADRLRKRRPDHVFEVSKTATRFDHESDESVLVESVMSRLSTDHREALTLKYVIGLSSAEIGVLMGRPSTAIDSLLQRARDAFAAEWSQISTDEVKP